MYGKYCVTVFLWFYVCFAHAQESNKPLENDNVVVLGVVEFPPLVIKDIEGFSCHGEAVTITRTILELLGYKVEVECPPPARLFERVRQGHVDITVNVKGTKALDKNVTFVEKPFTYLSLVLMTNACLNADKTVAAIRGYDYVGLRQELLDDGYTFFDMPNSTDAIQLFQFGRSTHLVTYEAPYFYHVERVPDNIKNVVVSMRRNIPTFLAVSNKSDRKQELLDKLTHLFRLSKSGTVIEQMQTMNE